MNLGVRLARGCKKTAQGCAQQADFR